MLNKIDRLLVHFQSFKKNGYFGDYHSKDYLEVGGPYRNRTYDTVIKSHLLYRLS